jgi:DNA-binding CsgD family transcriptional regulator
MQMPDRDSALQERDTRLTRHSSEEAVSMDMHRLLAQSSPRARLFLNGISADARRRLLDGIRQRLTADNPIVTVKCDSGPPLIAHLAAGGAVAPLQRAISLTDLNDFSVPSENTLRIVFDLTPAEARLAQGIARGDALEEVAASLGIKMSTARTQLAAIFAKTGARRQAKLVAILTRLAIMVG